LVKKLIKKRWHDITYMPRDLTQVAFLAKDTERQVANWKTRSSKFDTTQGYLFTYMQIILDT